MLTIRYPQVTKLVGELTAGLLPIWVKDDPIPKLIVKASKEVILTAKMNSGFAIYIAPYTLDDVKSIGFIAAFFDDDIHPLTCTGAIIDELGGEEFRKFFLGDDAEVYFFDELNREMLGFRARISASEEYKDLVRRAEFPSIKGLKQSSILELLGDWFSRSGPSDDAGALTVRFEESLFPEYVIFDMTPKNNSHQGSKGYSHTFLKREEPGEFQERDIINLLQRTFPAECIYSSPLRTYDKEEIVDVMVVTETSVLLIQAKDSPNVERILSNTLARKRATTNGALKKAIEQAKGAMGYLKRASPMSVIMNGKEVLIEYENKHVYSLIVVKELFDDDYDVYTPMMLDLAHKTGAPCIALSYPELHQYTTHLFGDAAFFEAYMRVFAYGVDNGIFPRLRLHHPDANR